MSVGIKPYLGTGLAEMLAQRGLEERASRMKQQEAMAPIFAQAQANAMAVPNLMSALTGNPMMAQRAQQGLAGLLSGYGMQGASQAAPATGAIPAADMASPLEGTGITIGDLIAANLPGVGEIRRQQLALPLQFAEQQIKQSGEATQQAQQAALTSQQILSDIASIRRQLNLGAEPGKLARTLSLAGKDKLAKFFQNAKNRDLQVSLINLYNQLRGGLGARLFSAEAPTALLPDMTLTGEQAAAMLDSIERAQYFNTAYAQKIAQLQEQTGGRLSQADITDLQRELAEHIRKMYEAQ